MKSQPSNAIEAGTIELHAGNQSALWTFGGLDCHRSYLLLIPGTQAVFTGGPIRNTGEKLHFTDSMKEDALPLTNNQHAILRFPDS